MYSCTAKMPAPLGRRHSVAFQTVTETLSADGQPSETWATVCTRRVSISPLQGREYWSGQQTLAEQKHIIKAQYDTTLATVTPKGRAVFGSRTFDIETISNPDEANKELHFICKESV